MPSSGGRHGCGRSRRAGYRSPARAASQPTAASARLTILSQQMNTPAPACCGHRMGLPRDAYIPSDLAPRTQLRRLLGRRTEELLERLRIRLHGRHKGGVSCCPTVAAPRRRRKAATVRQLPTAGQGPPPSPPPSTPGDSSSIPTLFLQVADADTNQYTKVTSPSSRRGRRHGHMHQVVTLPAGTAKLDTSRGTACSVALPPITTKPFRKDHEEMRDDRETMTTTPHRTRAISANGIPWRPFAAASIKSRPWPPIGRRIGSIAPTRQASGLRGRC